MKKSDKIKLLRGKSKAFVFANLTRPNVFPCAEKLIDLLVKNKVETYMVPEAKENISASGVNFSEPEKALPEVDIVFIIGGDGTILRAAKHAIKYDKPIYSIKLDDSFKSHEALKIKDDFSNEIRSYDKTIGFDGLIDLIEKHCSGDYKVFNQNVEINI